MGGGLYQGATDLITKPALLANTGFEALGLRTKEEAEHARKAIEYSLRTPPFISPQTEANLAEVARRHGGLNDIGRAAANFVGAKGLLRGALGKDSAKKVERRKSMFKQASKQINKQLRKRALKAARKKAVYTASKIVSPQVVEDTDVLPEDYDGRVVPDKPDRYIP